MFLAASVSGLDEDSRIRNVHSTNPPTVLSERVLILSRVLERQTRKHTITKRVSTVMKTPPCFTKQNHHMPPMNTPNERFLSPVRGDVDGKLYQCITVCRYWRHQLWLLLHDPSSSYKAKCISIFILFVVAVSIVVYIIQTQPDLDNNSKNILLIIEHICIYVFSSEFLIRLICTPNYKEFCSDIFNWIDMTSILPYYLEYMVDSKQRATSLSAIRTMRLIKVARILKLSRYTSSIHIFSKAISLSARPLFMLVFLMGLAMIVFSSAIYFAEMSDSICRNPIYSRMCHPDLNPQKNCCDLNPFTSIPASMWWCLVSMTTVGYGDVVPVTPVGKSIASLTMLSGMLILALPISVIGSNFQRVMKEFAHDMLKKNIQVVANMDVIRRAEMVQVLRSFQVIGENIDIDPDELIALYDLNQSGSLEADELENFRKDLSDLKNIIRRKQIQIVSPEKELRVRQLSFSGSYAPIFMEQSSTAKQLDMVEKMIETRLLESEVRMEAKISVLTKALLRLQTQLDLMGD